MSKENDNHISDSDENIGNILKTKNFFYLLFSIIIILGIGLCFYYIFDQTKNKAYWAVVSEEKMKTESFFNKDCSNILENIQSNQIDVNDVEKKLNNHLKSEHGYVFYLGIKAFKTIKDQVLENKEIELSELTDNNQDIGSFFNYFASNRSTNKEMLYPSFLASDIIVYIFNHRKIFNIHLSDIYLSGSEKREPNKILSGRIFGI